MPEPGMGSGGARGGSGMGGGGRQGRDEPQGGSLKDGFSFEDKRANAQRSGGHYEIERDIGKVWRQGPKKASPGATMGGGPSSAVTPVAKPASRIEMYLDDTPAAKVTNEPTGEIKHQIDTFSDFTPAPYSGALTASTGMTPLGWNLHAEASDSIQNDPTLTAAQKDAAKAENIVRLAKMSPWAAAAGAYPYQILQEIVRNPFSNPGEGWKAGWANIRGIGSALAEEDYFGKENSMTQGFKSGSLFNLGGNIANTQLGLMSMYDKLFGSKNPGG